MDRATQTNDRIRDIEKAIPDARTRLFGLAGAVKAANTNMDRAEYHINSIKKQVPEAISLIERYQARARIIDQMMNSMRYNISALREKISVTRGVANRVSTDLDAMMMGGYLSFVGDRLQTRNCCHITTYQ